MKTLQKMFVAMIAGVSLVAAASPAMAQTTFVPGDVVSASGDLTQSLGGNNVTICHVTFHGTVTGSGTTPTGFKFDSYEGTQIGGPGDLACDNSIQFDANNLVITGNVNSASTLTLQHILISTRDGSCEDSNITLDWSNPSVTFPDPTIIAPGCIFSGTLVVTK